MYKDASLNIHHARSRLRYEPVSGKFFRISRFGKVAPAETPEANGYLKINLDYKVYQCGRLAFLLMNGFAATGEIDHINGDKSDNRWCNLREVTRSQNAKNLPLIKSNTSGYKGVSRRKDGKSKWAAEIQCDRINYHLGYYDKLEDAAIAYEKAAEKLFGEFKRDILGMNNGSN